MTPFIISLEEMEGLEEKRKSLSCLKTKAYSYLTFSARTTHEIKQYLEGKQEMCHASQSDIETILKELTNEKLIDDKNYIQNYIEVKLRRGSKGVVALKNELYRRGISLELIEDYFQSNPVDEVVLVNQIIQKKWPDLTTTSDKKTLQKVYYSLRQKGFSYEAIQKAIEEVGFAG